MSHGCNQADKSVIQAALTAMATGCDSSNRTLQGRDQDKAIGKFGQCIESESPSVPGAHKAPNCWGMDPVLRDALESQRQQVKTAERKYEVAMIKSDNAQRELYEMRHAAVGGDSVLEAQMSQLERETFELERQFGVALLKYRAAHETYTEAKQEYEKAGGDAPCDIQDVQTFFDSVGRKHCKPPPSRPQFPHKSSKDHLSVRRPKIKIIRRRAMQMPIEAKFTKLGIQAS